MNLRFGEETQYIALEHDGCGFCLGKREKFTRVFISSVSRAADLFAKKGMLLAYPELSFLVVMMEIIKVGWES